MRAKMRMPDLGLTPDELQRMQAQYAKTLPEKIAKLESLKSRLETEAPDPEDLQHLQLSVHRLAGSASLYGYAELGRTAHSLDVNLSNITSGQFPLAKEVLTEVQALAQYLRGLLPAAE